MKFLGLFLAIAAVLFAVVSGMSTGAVQKAAFDGPPGPPGGMPSPPGGLPPGPPSMGGIPSEMPSV